jgi:ketosteroid isomerase-like protein
MSQENEIDKLAAAVAHALNERDPDALLGLVHSDFEFHSRLMAVEGRVYRGRDGFRDYFRDIDESFTDTRWSFDEIVGRSGDEVMVVFRFNARGRESGTPVDVHTAQVWTFRDGKVWRNVTYASRAEALKAAGLSE